MIFVYARRREDAEQYARTHGLDPRETHIHGTGGCVRGGPTRCRPPRTDDDQVIVLGEVDRHNQGMITIGQIAVPDLRITRLPPP